MALAGAVLLTLAPGATGIAAAAEPKTEAQQIIKVAKDQVGDPWRYGAKGPRAFDCSGLVIYSYTKAGEAKVIGNGRIRSARALYRYFKAKGLASRSNPKLGDLVVWGGGTHIGIYVGKGRAVSTLTSGVRVHGVHAVRAKFTAYLHTGMSTKAIDGSSIALASTATSSDGTNRIAVGDARRTDGRVNLRTGPGIQRARIATLRDGTKLIVLGKDKDARGRWWLKVEAGSRTGWVAKWLTD
jgi:hypothetical protein